MERQREHDREIQKERDGIQRGAERRTERVRSDT